MLEEQQQIAGETLPSDAAGCGSVHVEVRDRGLPLLAAASGFGKRSDEELSRLGGAGIEALFARHHAALHRFCLGFTRQDDEAADVMQIVWERAFVTFSQRRGTVAKVVPWLYAVARNECLDAIRARNVTQALDLSGVELAGGVSPEDCFEQRAELALLVDDLGELSERQRSALILRELAGFEGQQLASALGTSPPRALGLVAEARRGLIERRSGRGMPCVNARRELKRMRRRSTSVQAHLDSCPDCQSFERGRRGRSLSSLAISPLLLAHNLTERALALTPAAPQGILKASAAAALAVGSIGLMQPATPTRHSPPPKTASRSAAAKHQPAVSALHSTTAAAPDAAPVASSSRRRVLRTGEPTARARTASPPPSTVPPAPTTRPPRVRVPAPKPTPAPTDAAPSTAGTALKAVLPELAAGVDAAVSKTLAAAQQATETLHSAVKSALTLLVPNRRTTG